MAVQMGCRTAQMTSTRYLCANCWGELTWQYIDDSHCEVSCTTSGCPCSGFVSKSHVEHIEAQSTSEMLKVKYNLRKYLDWLRYAPKTTDQIMHDLGF